MKLTDQEKREIVRYLEQGKDLPDKYRFLVFEEKREVELMWNGKTNEVSNVILPFQVIEQIDEPRAENDTKLQMGLFDLDARGRQLKGWTNKLIWGDNKLILSSLKNGPLREEIEEQGGIKLIYIDPPFDVGADFSMDIEIGDETLTKEPTVLEELAYRDTWGKGADSFIAMIYERLSLMHDLMAEDSSIYVHCDWRVSPFIRLVLDEIFGKSGFRNEVTWRYRTYQGQVRNYFPRKHDTIFFYTKGEPFFELQKDNNFEENIDFKRWNRFLVNENEIRGNNYPKTDSRFDVFVNKWRKENPDKKVDENAVLYRLEGMTVDSVWDIKALDPKDVRRLGYPTQKPDELLELILSASTKENDLIADFFAGSGTTLAVAERLKRKWIGSDLGKFSIHTTRKRMIGVQRELKKNNKDYRAFKILNLGKYERQHYVGINPNLRDEEKQKQIRQKEKEFVELILRAYQAQAVAGFRTFYGKKSSRMVVVGPVNLPVSRLFVEEVIRECVEKKITKVDILAFEFEMGLFPNIQEEAKTKGVDLVLKYIPPEVFDKRAVEKNQVVFYDVAFIEIKPHIKGHSVAVELTDFSVFYNQDSIANVESQLQNGGKKLLVENGQIIKVEKDKNGIVSREVLTKKWTDWIDYWAVDFDFENKKEIVRVRNANVDTEQKRLLGSEDPKQMKFDQYKEVWTGDYIFENEWQSFRTKKDRSLELRSVSHECSPGRRKIAVKVVDIFGNDTMKIIEVSI